MPRLRLLKKYPFEEITDSIVIHRGRECMEYNNETSLMQNLDLSSVDDTMKRVIQDAFKPSTVDYLSNDEVANDNVFETLNPITSRFATDRCLRNELINQLSDVLKRKQKEESDEKAKKELKEKYDKFIQSLG